MVHMGNQDIFGFLRFFDEQICGVRPSGNSDDPNDISQTGSPSSPGRIDFSAPMFQDDLNSSFILYYLLRTCNRTGHELREQNFFIHNAEGEIFRKYIHSCIDFFPLREDSTNGQNFYDNFLI